LDQTRPIILYVVSEDWVFLGHRLPMARAARNAGFDVHVATQTTGKGDAIRAEGFTLHPIPFRRGAGSALSALATIRALRRLEKSLRPAIIHHSSLQCCVYGSLAALGTGLRQVNALTGMGYAYTSQNLDARLLKAGITALLRFFFNKKESITLVENPDDLAQIEKLGISHDRIALIRGSGVDTRRFESLPEPEGPITIGFAGRLLTDKGIRALVTAHRLLRERGLDIHLLIAGATDPSNPASVSEEEAASWNHESGITWLGQIADIKELWARSHIAVLPSHREGLPVSLMEAAACGRPLVATDVQGCREIAIEDRTGLLVPVENPAALADAIATLAASRELRLRYGSAGRAFVIEHLSADVVGKAIVELYRRHMAH
jgi:glycosyltransferase involved in cell wall biosynthesis